MFYLGVTSTMSVEFRAGLERVLFNLGYYKTSKSPTLYSIHYLSALACWRMLQFLLLQLQLLLKLHLLLVYFCCIPSVIFVRSDIYSTTYYSEIYFSNWCKVSNFLNNVFHPILQDWPLFSFFTYLTIQTSLVRTLRVWTHFHARKIILQCTIAL